MGNGKKIIILGTGGNCVDILDTIQDINSGFKTDKYQCLGFLDDEKQRWGKEIHGKKVLGPLSSAVEFKDSFFVNGIGSPYTFFEKEAVIAKTGVEPERFETIIHPSASVSRTAQIGRGTVVFQNVTITTNVKIGRHVIILPGSVVSHDDIVGDYTCIAGGTCVSGEIKVGKSCYLGTNSCIIGRITIGEYCLIGMGAVVLRDVPPNSVMVGNPAVFLRCTR